VRAAPRIIKASRIINKLKDQHARVERHINRFRGHVRIVHLYFADALNHRADEAVLNLLLYARHGLAVEVAVQQDGPATRLL
jgi:hypothetical protein